MKNQIIIYWSKDDKAFIEDVAKLAACMDDRVTPSARLFPTQRGRLDGRLARLVIYPHRICDICGGCKFDFGQLRFKKSHNLKLTRTSV